MKRYSSLTFNELTKNLCFIKVWWNHKLIYDDTGYIPLISFDDLSTEYGNKYVYSMKVKVVEGHHCELRIKGEK